jgi:hypothetical protein
VKRESSIGTTLVEWQERTRKSGSYQEVSRNTRSAAKGVEDVLRILEGRWKLVILFHLFGGKAFLASELSEFGVVPLFKAETYLPGIDGVARWWDNPTMIVTLDSKRRLTVPATLAPTSPGEYFDAQFDAEEDAIVFRRLAGKEDWLAVLKECPVSMDDVPPKRREMARRRKL